MVLSSAEQGWYLVCQFLTALLIQIVKLKRAKGYEIFIIPN